MSHKKRLLAEYNGKKKDIQKRLGEFLLVWTEPNERIFSELCFCICTPQSKAVHCHEAVSGLVKSGQLFSGDVCEVRDGLKKVRFPNNKARYIIEAREKLSSVRGLDVKGRISDKDVIAAREWLVNNVKGIGYKEASHFLRNIGLGSDLAILDIHIMNNMVEFGVIDERPKTLTKKKYMELEIKLKDFSKKVGIPLAELDLLFWSMKTGHIFK
jgi:N-glycosylase/DNA lyase